MSAEDKIAEATDYCELVEGFRIRRRELGLTVDKIDELGGFARGHTGKLLGPAYSKKFGPVSLGTMLGVLGLKILLVEDSETAARMVSLWEKRERPDTYASNGSMALIKRMKPVVFAIHMAVARAHRNDNLSPTRRRSIARNAARARWGKKHKNGGG